jgi:RNA polymerase sigma-70 factor (ECF subfamily)
VDGSPDRALVLAVRSGDPVAFGRAHSRYGPRLFNFLARMSGRRDVAEDLYQETWIKLAVHASRLTEDTDLGAWLYTVARNLARSERRSERSRTLALSESALEGTSDRGASPHDWAAANETEALVDRALADLPGPLREVLLLIVVAGLEQEQVAEILDLKPDALRQRLTRARAKLSERLDELMKPTRATVKE